MTKISVYIALGGAAVVSSVDIIVNGSTEASTNIAIALIAFATARQAIGMKTGK